MEIADVTRDDVNQFAFGMDEQKTVTILRELADKIERKEIVVQRAKLISSADNEDFAFETLRLTWAAANQAHKPDKIKELHGSGPFPVALAKP